MNNKRHQHGNNSGLVRPKHAAKAHAGASNRAAATYAHVPQRASSRPSGALTQQPVQRTRAPGPDPFDFRAMMTGHEAVQQKAAANDQSADVGPVAAAGVAGAAEPLPHLDAIQTAFGRHDVSGVRVASGAEAQRANTAMGAQAYATGNTIAFGHAPNLHLAAHEAAHVVQQRAGVSLASAVGRSGDKYEQHADRVADLVAAGQSAEQELDTMAVGSGATAAVQRFDSPHHVAIGDSVSGESITIVGVEFSAGESAALVDYVGPLVEFKNLCEQEQAEEGGRVPPGDTAKRVGQMLSLLQVGSEDSLLWDTLTNGKYSELTKKNEDHFSPGEDGDSPNHSDTFVAAFAEALKSAGQGNVEEGRMHMYTAEHFIQDAFSSGHMVAQPDIDEAVHALIGIVGPEQWGHMKTVANAVFDRGQDTISHYANVNPFGKPIAISKTQFRTLSVGGIMFSPNLIYSSVRKFVHDRLDAGVEVTSPLHPDPWIMYGDHDLNMTDSETTVVTLQQALVELRDLFDATVSNPIANPEQQAQALLDQHKPVATASGEATVAAAIELATSDDLALINAMTEAGVATLAGAMDYLVNFMPHDFVRLDSPHELKPGPGELPQVVRDAPQCEDDHTN